MIWENRFYKVVTPAALSQERRALDFDHDKQITTSTLLLRRQRQLKECAHVTIEGKGMLRSAMYP